MSPYLTLNNDGQCWTMLNNVEQCWTMLNNIEQCWTMLNNVDSTVFNSDSPHCAKACSPQYTSSFLNCNFIIHHVLLDIAEKCFQLYSKVDYCAVLIVRLYEDCTTHILYSVLLVRWLYDNCTTRILYSVLIVLYADPILPTIILLYYTRIPPICPRIIASFLDGSVIELDRSVNEPSVSSYTCDN